jgi:hypothetical protein
VQNERLVTTSRTFTVRLLPPRLPGRMSGSTWLHSASVKSLGYRSLLRSYRERFSIVHIGDLSTTQAAILAPQTLDLIQYASEQALRNFGMILSAHAPIAHLAALVALAVLSPTTTLAQTGEGTEPTPAEPV